MISNLKYYIIFIDDFSRMTWLYLLHNRSEVSSCFALFIKELSTQHSSVIKIFRSDNALEFKSRQFQSLILDNSIVHETSCPHTQ